MTAGGKVVAAKAGLVGPRPRTGEQDRGPRYRTGLGGACLLALALASAPARAERVPVPGGPEAVRRLLGLGGGRPDRELFLDVSRALLAESNPRGPWEEVPNRRAVVRFAEDLAEWKATAGCPVTLSARGEAWERSRRALEWLGFRVRGDGPGFEVEPLPEPEAHRRQAFLDVLGQPTFGAIQRLSEGGEVTVSCGGGDVEMPLDLETWREILAVDATVLSRDTAFLHFVTHVPASRMLAALGSVDGRTREEARALAGPAGGAGGLKLLYDEALDGFTRFPEALVLRDGRVRLPGGPEARDAWANVVGVPTSDPARFVVALFSRESGKPAYVADALGQLPEPVARAFVLGPTAGGVAAVTRFRRIYDAIESVGGGFASRLRGGYDFEHLLRFLELSKDGEVVIPGGAALWLEALASRSFPADEEELAGLLARAGERAVEPDELLVRLLKTRVEGAVMDAPAQKRFLLVSSLVRARPVLADPGTIVLLFRGLERLLPSYGPLEDLPLDDPAVVRRFLFTLNRLDTTGTERNAELRAGLFQASADLLAAFCRSGALGDERARALVRSLLGQPLFATSGAEPFIEIASFEAWLREDLLAALRAEEARALDSVRGAGAGPAGDRPRSAPSSDELVASALAGWRPPVVFEWRGGRYRYDPTADGAARRRAFAATQRCVLLSDLEAAGADLETAFRTAREGDADGMRTALAGFAERLAADRPAARDEDARVVSAATSARSAIDELGRANASNALARLQQRRPRLDALRAERTLEALVLHVYSSSVGDPADLAFTDASLVRRHSLRWGDRRSGLVESPFGPTRLERLGAGGGSRIAGSFAGLVEVLGDLHAEQLVHEEGAHLANETVRAGLVGPVLRVTPARLDDDALAFVALSCRAAEELAATLAARPEAERLEAWSALAPDLVSQERRNGLAASSPAEIGAYLTPSDLFRIGRRLALRPAAGAPTVPAARAAFDARGRLVARLGEGEAARRVAELGPRPLAWAGLSRLTDIDMPPYERLSRYREPQLFADRLYDLKVAVARAVFAAGDPAVLLPVALAPALDDVLRGARMATGFDWRALVAPIGALDEGGRDRVLEDALYAGRIELAREAGE